MGSTNVDILGFEDERILKVDGILNPVFSEIYDKIFENKKIGTTHKLNMSRPFWLFYLTCNPKLPLFRAQFFIALILNFCAIERCLFSPFFEIWPSS